MGIVVQSRGRSGEILVTDERDDGARVYLICHPWDASIGNGVFVGPADPPAEDKDLEGTFPLFAIRAESKPFRITIDTTRLPAGPLQFRSEDFVEMARIAAEDGADHLTLDETTAEKWGLIREY